MFVIVQNKMLEKKNCLLVDLGGGLCHKRRDKQTRTASRQEDTLPSVRETCPKLDTESDPRLVKLRMEECVKLCHKDDIRLVKSTRQAASSSTNMLQGGKKKERNPELKGSCPQTKSMHGPCLEFYLNKL